MNSKLFVLEDENIAQYIMRAILQPFKSFTASFFDKSLILIDFLIKHVGKPEHLPDVIFLDIHLPDLDGWDVLETISHITPLLQQEIPVYIISTSVSPIDRKRALAYPFVRDFFSKPVTTNQIREVEKSLNNFTYSVN